MTFTAARVVADAAAFGLLTTENVTIAALREMLARHFEDDPVQAQEVRSGRPWDQFTVDDMEAIERRAPGYWRRNPGLLRRRIELGMPT